MILNPAGGPRRSEVDFARHLEVIALSEAAERKLHVLVWGPTPEATGSQARFAEKRKQIKAALKSDGHFAYFSEDLVSRNHPAPSNLLELLQVRDMDAVVILATDYGPMGEAHEFGPILGEKLLLWLPLAAKGKFIEGVRRYINAAGGKSAFFTDKHVDACCITLASVDFVNDKRFLQMAIEEEIALLRRQAPIKSRRL